MRRSRWLLLVAIFFIVISVGATYIKRKAEQVKDRPTPPAPLETGLDGRASDWVYTQSEGDHPRVTVRARRFRQVKAPSVMELEGVQLQLFHQDGVVYDLVKCASAQFDITGRSLYSDGDVEITMGVPSEGAPAGRLVTIQTSGVHFASDTGRAATERAAQFQFEHGGGSATGADYDPILRELHLMNDVSLHLEGAEGSIPMDIDAAEAYYKEMEGKIYLQNRSRLRRGTLVISGASSVFTLENGELRHAAAEKAKGVQNDAGRRVEFEADWLNMDFGPRMAAKTIRGDHHGKLVSTAKALRTTATGDIINLVFDTSSGESILSSATASGGSVVESRPMPVRGEPLQDTRTLKSDVIRLKMRPGGEEMDSAETDGPGTVDFIPNRPGQPKRFVQGDKIWMEYGPANRLRNFRTINAVTRTEKPNQAEPMITRSKNLQAYFNADSGDLSSIEQNQDFRYEEGPRRASANQAVLEQSTGIITLEASARVTEPSGSVSADHIVYDPKSGDMRADGHVASTRQPDKNGPSSAMLSNSDVMQARAQRMTSAERNLKLHYEGSAVLWQGPNRVEADRIDIDRTRQVLEARGNVVSQFADRANDNKGKSKAQTAVIFTVVKAPEMIYDENSRIANYRGGASLSRPGLTVDSREIRAFLKDSQSNSSLDKAFADGAVKIVSTEARRTRTGTSEHAEYYADEQKVVLNGGDPLLVDQLRGQTRGRELTWWANNDRLLVNGVENRPADSLLRKK